LPLGHRRRQARPPAVRSVATVAVPPTREEITTAYQSALQAALRPLPHRLPQVPVAAPPVAASPARKLDADELAALLNRAKRPPCRRLTFRPPDYCSNVQRTPQDASAALMLARTLRS